MYNTKTIYSVLYPMFETSKLLFIAPYTSNIDISKVAVICSIMSIFGLAIVSVNYVMAFKQFDPEWYIYTEHFFIDGFITGVWFVMFVVCVMTPVMKYRTIKLIMIKFQKVHDSLILIKTSPRYKRFWLYVKLVSRLFSVLTAILLTYLKIEYYGSFMKSWMNLLSYVPLLVMYTTNTEMITMMSVAASQFEVMILKLKKIGNSSLKEKVIMIERITVLHNKICTACILTGKYFEPQLFVFVLHIFLRVTSNLYYAIFTSTTEEDVEGFATNSLIWAGLDIFELWRVLVALSTVSSYVEKFYYTLYDLTTEDKNFLLAISPRVNLLLEKRFRLKFLIGGLFEFDLPLLPMMIGAICTNLVLCIQFQNRIRL